MSGETEDSVSGWTVDTLREHFQLELDHLVTQLNDRFEAHKVYVRDYQVAQLDVLRQRLDAIDKATELLHAQVTHFPTDVDKQVSHLRELHDEKFLSVGNQFQERDTRSERESRDNKTAVDAAFAASKEASAEQNKSNTLAIDKSEKATAETINKLAQLFETSIASATGKIDDVKERQANLEKVANGMTQNKVGGQAAIASVIAFIFVLIAIAGVIITLVSTSSP